MMDRVKIFLKNGLVVEADVDEFEITRNVLTGQFEGIAWTSGEKCSEKLLHVDVDEIAAITSMVKAGIE